MDSKSYQFFLGLLLALALFAQGLIPSGYMPVIGKGKIFEITICHGNDQATILVDDNMQPVKGQGQGDTDHQKSAPCLFMGMSAKYLAQQDFIFQQVEHLIYAQYVVRDMGEVATILPTKFYEGQAPPVNQLTV